MSTKRIKVSAIALSCAVLFAALPLTSAEAQYYHPPVEVAPAFVENTGPYLRKRPVYFMRPSLARQPTLEVAPSCYMSRQRIWLDRYTYTHRYTRVCD